MKDICDYVKNEGKCFVYGMGLYGQYCYRKIEERYGPEKVAGYILSDSSSNRGGKNECIYSPKEAFDMADGDSYVILTGTNSVEQMRKQCVKVGFNRERIVVPEGISPYLKKNYDEHIRDICVWPMLRKENVDLVKKLKWFIPGKIKVHIGVDDDENIPGLPSNFEIHDSMEIDGKAKESDIILLWDVKSSDALGDRYPGKIRVIDPLFFKSIDTINYDRLYYASLSDNERRDVLEDSKRIFSELILKVKCCKKAAVFCSGPSISEVYDMPKEEFKDCFTIVCNSMVKDMELMNKLDPDLVVFTDTNFFCSPSEYGEAFFCDLIREVEKHNMYIAVRNKQKPLLLCHFPQLKDRIIGVPYTDAVPSGEYRFISKDFFYMQRMNNILLDLMIPFASAVCDEIYIAGCTGRKEGETYFWEHNGRTQYLDLKQTVFDMWPAFFKYNDYEDYYDAHCQKVEGQLKYGEALGKKYINITTSFIPALIKRTKHV